MATLRTDRYGAQRCGPGQSEGLPAALKEVPSPA